MNSPQGVGETSPKWADEAGDDGDDVLETQEPPPELPQEPVPAPTPWLEGRHVPSGRLTGLLVAIGCSLFVFFQMQPELLFSSTTPSGGDMGAHVWGPAYMRDSLLSQGRLTGWTPDWYAGFPAYHFYMVVPPLAILTLNSGITLWLGVPATLFVLGFGFWLGRRFPRHRILVWIFSGFVGMLLIGLPYGTSFKLISVSGLVGIPLAAWALGRLGRSPEPIPGLLAVASVFFLFDTNFTIYGGNVASTLAGEFAFSIALCLTLLAFAVSLRGMDTGGYRPLAVVLIALVALTHLIPLFFLVAGLAMLVVMQPGVPRAWIAAAGLTLALLPVGAGRDASVVSALAASASFVVVVGAVLIANANARQRATWLLVVGPTAACISAFWLLPFYLRSDYFNDMGWERLDVVRPALLTTPMKILLPVAFIGAVLAFALGDRVGMLMAVMAGASAAGVAYLPEGKLWNARLLPFYYLSVYLAAGIGIALVIRFGAVAVSERFDRPDRRIMFAGTALALLTGLVTVAMPLRVLPFGSVDADGRYEWIGIRSSANSFIPSWVSWNYSGYEEKRSYREYRDIVDTMEAVGSDRGCGRAMWEYDKGLDRYGTPMALMLLPHWTDGCIGSMEGLYFESSATTPFHFLHQSTLSVNPSQAQRDLPYKSFDLGTGVAQLQVMGVRYYLAQSDEATAAAKEHTELTLVASSEPWSIFEVHEAPLVQGLAIEPVVTSGPDNEQIGEAWTRFDVGWVSQAIAFYNDPSGFQALPAEDGPASWDRVEYLLPTDGVAIEPTTVSNIEQAGSSIKFDVDQIGQPVLVKTSYFPNWKANGADGPWRVGPNMMAVVPTDSSVELSYGYTGAELAGYVVTFAGLVVLMGLYRHDRRALAGNA